MPRQKAHMVFSKINPLIVDKGHFSLSRVSNSHRLPAYGLWLSPYFLTKRRMTFKSFYLTLRPSDSVEVKALLESKVMDSIVMFRKILTERFSDRGVSFFLQLRLRN